MGLHLVNDCYDDLPMFALGSRELEALAISAREEADLRCCEPVDEAMTDRHFVSRYGVTVATDILLTHKRDGEKLMQKKAHYMDQIWINNIKQELFSLGVNANQPQDDQKVVEMISVRDQLVLMMSTELNIVHEVAEKID
jgi:hypothetical protein